MARRLTNQVDKSPIEERGAADGIPNLLVTTFRSAKVSSIKQFVLARPSTRTKFCTRNEETSYTTPFKLENVAPSTHLSYLTTRSPQHPELTLSFGNRKENQSVPSQKRITKPLQAAHPLSLHRSQFDEIVSPSGRRPGLEPLDAAQAFLPTANVKGVHSNGAALG